MFGKKRHVLSGMFRKCVNPSSMDIVVNKSFVENYIYRSEVYKRIAELHETADHADLDREAINHLYDIAQQMESNIERYEEYYGKDSEYKDVLPNLNILKELYRPGLVCKHGV